MHLLLVKQMVGIKLSFPLSLQPWPITGGKNLAPDPPQRDLLLTGSVYRTFKLDIYVSVFCFVFLFFFNCNILFVRVGTRMGQFVSGMHQECVCIPCTS